MHKQTKGCLLAAAAAAGAVAAWGGEPIRPLSSPVLVDSAEVSTYVHPIFAYHKIPDKVETTSGLVPVGGDVELYALALEYAFTKDLSLIAVKDGYMDFNPDDTLEADTGFADLAAGLKYVFHRGEGLVASAKVVVELPTGDDEVFQGNGSGTIDPAIAVLKQSGKLQVQGTLGYIQPFDDEESASFYDSWHLSYEVAPGLFPLVELNHMHVTDAGDGSPNFMNQAGGGLPSILTFEGVDIVNFGAANGDENADYVSLALGLRYRACEAADLGVGYEFPLTDKEQSLTEYRVTADIVWRL